MKKFFFISILFVLAGCGGRQPSGDLIEIDLTANYPEKDIDFSDYFETSYISLENDTSLVSNFRMVARTPEGYIGYDGRQGDVLCVSPEGKITRMFNNKGNGPGEYKYIHDMVFDAKAGEFFISDYAKEQIMVLNRQGNLLRSFPSTRGDKMLEGMKDYDKDHLIIYNLESFRDESPGVFRLISKADGKAVDSIALPVSEYRNPQVSLMKDKMFYIFSPHIYHMIDAGDYILLNESACDTIYKLTKKGNRLEPYIVKTPLIRTFDKNKTPYLFPCLDTPDFTVLNKTTAVIGADGTPDYQDEEYFYDKKERQVYKLRGKHKNYKKGFDCTVLGNAESPYGLYIICKQASRLCDLIEKEELEGELKEIASGLDPEDNPVLEVLNLKNR